MKSRTLRVQPEILERIKQRKFVKLPVLEVTMKYLISLLVRSTRKRGNANQKSRGKRVVNLPKE